MQFFNSNRDHGCRWVRGPCLALALALVPVLGVSTGCAYEWVSSKSKIERYEVDAAKKICRRWAQKQLDDEESAFGLPRPQTAKRSYHSYFNECMRKHGWERVPAGQVEENEETQQSGDERERE